MTYEVLARKWRPQEFAGVVGQEPIVTALRNALSEKRIAQAYLFSGIRGVGKTSVARLFAKALNCEQGPTPEPCNECRPCREITAGSDLDVLEVDAATYSKVEQVRELTESLKYGPARNRYKVVVLDEVHRLSRQAFDALLKIVEEPPAHLVFLFATTEIEDVPATVLSRCQEFHFRRVPAPRLAEHLRTICDSEELEASDAALRMIARAAEGSVRDSVALLDQMATFGRGKIADEEAARLLGGLAIDVQRRLLRAVVGADRQAITGIIAQIEDEGWDPRQAFADFLGYCRSALHLALGGSETRVDLPEEEGAALAALAREAGYENLLRLVHLLLNSESTVRRSESGSLALEIAWLRAAELPRLVRLEEVLKGGSVPPRSGPPVADKENAPQAPEVAPAPRRPKATPAAATEKRASEPEPPQALESDAPETGSAPEGGKLEELLQLLSRRQQLLAAHLAEAEHLSFDNEELLIHTLPEDPWLRKALARPKNRRVLEEGLAAVWGEGARWRLVERSPAAAPETDPAAGDPDPAPGHHPTVQTALELFGGKVETVDNDNG